jgi:alginate O-acetyltransferase complex protein AlgI
MTFISIIYAFFLLAVLVIYWSARTSSLRLRVLLIASLSFYALLQIKHIHLLVLHLPLLFLITLINFYLGQALGVNTAPGSHITNQHLSNEDWLLAQGVWNRRRFKLLWLGIVLNVVCLLSFKYVPFILTNLAAPLDLPVTQESASRVNTHLIAPLGLSFFTFECIAYLIDVYRGAPATQQLLQFASYKLFFPKLISGPITRYHQFVGGLKTLQFPSSERVTEGLWLIASGAVKKALLADRLGIFVDLCFGNLERAGSGDLWLAIVAYGLQLYLDFSGYVDIARGSAILLGINLPENFDFPYFSTSIADFWRRWHITLGDWIRNYLYFPLGGSRKGLGRTCLNLLIVMLITGIWHGAAWGFVVWGGLHGLALVVHRLTQAISERLDWLKSWWQSLLGVFVAWLLTQSMVFISWIFFRLPSIKQASLVIQNLWGHEADIQFAQKVYVEAMGLGREPLALLLATLIAFMVVIYSIQRGLKLQLNWPLKLLLVPLCLFTVLVLAPQGGLPYIYFDF